MKPENCKLCHSDLGHYAHCSNLKEDEEKWLRAQKEKFGMESVARNLGFKVLKELNLIN